MGALAYDLLIGFSLCLLGVMSVGPGLDTSILYAPIIMGPVFLIALGLSWFLSALGVFIRDIGQIGSFLGLALLYSSGVFYSAEKAEASAPVIWQFLQWNPLTDYRLQCALSFGRATELVFCGLHLDIWSGSSSYRGVVFQSAQTRFCRCSLNSLVKFFGSSFPAMFCSPFFTICP